MSLQTPRVEGPARIIVNTLLSASSSTLIVTFFRLAFLKEYSRINMFDIHHMSNGVFAGLVGITAACDVVEPWAAFIIGIGSGLTFILGSWLLKRL